MTLDVVFLADLGAVIPCAADFDLDFSFPFSAGALCEEFRMIGVGCEGEAGRPPRALTDPVCPRSFESGGYPANWRASEATATLNRRKVIADDFLNPSDSVTERLKIPFC